MTMRILILGAGVIGTTYAWQLSNAGQDVTLLVRKTNLEMVRKEGFIFDARMNAKKILRQLKPPIIPWL